VTLDYSCLQALYYSQEPLPLQMATGWARPPLSGPSQRVSIILRLGGGTKLYWVWPCLRAPAIDRGFSTGGMLAALFRASSLTFAARSDQSIRSNACSTLQVPPAYLASTGDL
jgi:hypothetical protein